MGFKESYRNIIYDTYMSFTTKQKLLENFKKAVMTAETCKNGVELGLGECYFYAAGDLLTVANSYRGLTLLVTPTLSIKRTLCKLATYRYLRWTKVTLYNKKDTWEQEADKIAEKTMYQVINEVKQERKMKKKEDKKNAKLRKRKV